jgi:uncharacterized circularly permuted ATP-grasp superfamily protein/uncharacterized alpha-E superfamily protein
MGLSAADLPKVLPPSWRYHSNPGFYDELLDADGKVRPHWQALVDSLRNIGSEGLASRWQEGRRLVHSHGVTYNMYGDPQSMDRPWPLDPIPSLIGPEEWAKIETAVIQRATLLNAMLLDLYGEQRLLRENLLPPELVYRHPGFLRPCSGIALPGGIHLHTYCADIARSPDGNWWVIADRTQAPSGAGYALENRLVTSRVLPDVFRAAHVRRLATYFQTYRETLRSLAPGRRENPRIVLLTSGPYNETYFEHAFLARYLGYTLVEGGDLMVRDNRVFLKTLGGLLPVDVIARRQDDSYCDPLELRADSMLGVPGLVQAVRSGNVMVANALGTGLLESSAPAAFLPGLCRHLLGEDLKMPSIATWWCGEAEPLREAVEKLAKLVIKPAVPSPEIQPVFGSKLSAAEREALVARIRSAPGRYVAQEQVSLSTVPVWNDGRLEPRHQVLRIYAVATHGTYSVMPGGLTRVTSSLDSLVVSMQHGGGSKDTWVLADGPTPQFSLLRPASTPMEVSRATFDLPSRVADNLFWLGRYVERVDLAVRVSRTILPRLYQDSDPATAAGFDTGLRVLTALGYVRPVKIGSGDRVANLEKELFAMIYDSTGKGGLAWNIHQIRHVGWLLRDRISADTWRILNQFDQQFSAPAPPDALRMTTALDLLDHAVLMVSAFGGLVMEGMTRGDGWRFLNIGRRLERTIQMLELLTHGLGFSPAQDPGSLETLLEIADSSLTYRSRYLTSMHPELVVDLLLLDEANPRSVAFQLVRLREHIDELPESFAVNRRPEEARMALDLLTSVQLAQISELMEPAQNREWDNLRKLTERLTAKLHILSETLTRGYFSHVISHRQMSAP